MENISPIYNLGNERGYSVREIIKVVQEVTGRSIPTRIASRRKGDPSVLVASSEKIKKELGWRPQHQDIYEIVESAWKWRRRHPQGYEEEK
jgi:UDP-glucose 4-epimerase